MKKCNKFREYLSSVHLTRYPRDYSNLSNGQVSHKLKSGDKVSCTISELQPLKAQPQDIPLDILYEDDHLLVVNKPPHMVLGGFFYAFVVQFV